jgi:hypothetical protein
VAPCAIGRAFRAFGAKIVQSGISLLQQFRFASARSLPFSAAGFIPGVHVSLRSPPWCLLHSPRHAGAGFPYPRFTDSLPSCPNSACNPCLWGLHGCTHRGFFSSIVQVVRVDPSIKGRAHHWQQGPSLLLTKLYVFTACRTIGRVTKSSVMDTTRILCGMRPNSATQNWVCVYAASLALHTSLLAMPHVLPLCFFSLIHTLDHLECRPTCVASA